MYNILAIGAHPDDIEIGCGGSLLKFKKMGSKIIYSVMTNGENWNGKNEKIRLLEQHDVCKEMNIDKIHWMGMEDGNVRVDTNVIDKLESIIINEKIDIVFSIYKNDTHQDHVELYKIVNSATRFCPNVFYYEGLSSKSFQPNIFIDISEYIEAKKNIINKFESQVSKYNKRKMDLVELIECKDRINGLKTGFTYAEGFIVGKVQFDKLILNKNTKKSVLTY